MVEDLLLLVVAVVGGAFVGIAWHNVSSRGGDSPPRLAEDYLPQCRL
jgi:hypothetical protein